MDYKEDVALQATGNPHVAQRLALRALNQYV